MTLDRSGLDDILGYQLRRAQHFILQQFEQRFAAFGIRPTEYSMLVLLRDNPGLRQSDVAEALGVKRANLVGMSLHLSQRGLISRSEDETDRRADCLSLTPAGATLLAEAIAVQAAFEAECAERLGGPAERSRFLAMLVDLARDRP